MGVRNSTLGYLVNMSHPSVIYWPPQDTIALTQDIANGGKVVFGNVSGAPGVFKYNNIIRSIIIASSDDISGVVFTVSGTGADVDADNNPTTVLRPIVEEITGINVGEAESTHIFSQIDSITTTGGAATNVTVIYGLFGITQYVLAGCNRTMSQTVASAQVVDGIGIEYTVYKSYNKPEVPNIVGYKEIDVGVDTVPYSSSLEPFGVEIVNKRPTQIAFIPAFEVIATTSDTAHALVGPSAVVWATITGSTSDSLYFTVLQQGIN